MSDEPLSKNVVFLPTVIENGKRKTKEVPTVQETVQRVVDEITTRAKKSNAVFALVVDEETGSPAMIMGGLTDLTFMNMFLDLLKDEVKDAFMSETQSGFSGEFISDE